MLSSAANSVPDWLGVDFASIGPGSVDIEGNNIAHGQLGDIPRANARPFFPGSRLRRFASSTAGT